MGRNALGGIALAATLTMSGCSWLVGEGPQCEATAAGIEERRLDGFDREQGDPTIIKPGYQYQSSSGCIDSDKFLRAG